CMDTGVCCRLVSRRWAVTMTSSSWAPAVSGTARVGAISHPDLRVSRRFISPSLFPCCAPTHGVGRRLDEYPANALKRNLGKRFAALRTFANAAIRAALAVERGAA